MKLELEFIRRKHIPWFGLIFLLCVAIGTAFEINEWRLLNSLSLSKQEHILVLEKILKDKQQKLLQSEEVISPASALRIKEHKKIQSTLNYPWNRVLATIEQTEVDDVAILSLIHEQSSGKSQLAVEALDAAALIRFVNKLNDGEQGSESTIWYIADYQGLSQNSPPTVKATILNK